LYVLQSAAVLRLAVAVVLLGLAATGASCSLQIRHPPYVAQPQSALQEVDESPPPARVEILPPVPSPQAVWVDGEWMWRRERWAWLPGRWVDLPPGIAFSPWVFLRGPDGRLWYAPGVWRDISLRTPVDPPGALATASVETGVVVTAEGATEVTGPSIRQRPRPASSAAPPAPSVPSPAPSASTSPK
jgi:hypothetical protein